MRAKGLLSVAVTGAMMMGVLSGCGGFVPDVIWTDTTEGTGKAYTVNVLVAHDGILSIDSEQTVRDDGTLNFSVTPADENHRFSGLMVNGKEQKCVTMPEGKVKISLRNINRDMTVVVMCDGEDDGLGAVGGAGGAGVGGGAGADTPTGTVEDDETVAFANLEIEYNEADGVYDVVDGDLTINHTDGTDTEHIDLEKDQEAADDVVIEDKGTELHYGQNNVTVTYHDDNGQEVTTTTTVTLEVGSDDLEKAVKDSYYGKVYSADEKMKSAVSTIKQNSAWWNQVIEDHLGNLPSDCKDKVKVEDDYGVLPYINYNESIGARTAQFIQAVLKNDYYTYQKFTVNIGNATPANVGQTIYQNAKLAQAINGNDLNRAFIYVEDVASDYSSCTVWVIWDGVHEKI